MSNLMNQAINLAVYGMGTVFVFLTVLVGCTILMSWLLRSSAPQDQKPGPNVQPEVLAAIGAAVKQYRKDHQGNS